MKFLKSTFLFMCVIGLQFSQAQTKYLDSLKKIIKTATIDSNRYNAYDYLLYELIHNAYDYQVGIKLSNQLIKLAKSKNDSTWITSGYTYLGNAYLGIGDYNQSIENFKLGGEYYKDKKNSLKKASTLTNIAEAYRLKGDYESALKYNLQALTIKEERKDTAGMAISLNNIGSVYFAEKNFNMALDYFFKAFEIRKKGKKKIQIAMSLNNIGLVYQDRAENNIRLKKKVQVKPDYDLALSYYLKAKEIVEELQTKEGMSIIYNNIGNIYHLRAENLGDKKNYDSAMFFYDKTLKIRTEIGDQGGLSATYNNMGNIYVSTGNVAKGLEYLNSALELSKRIGFSEVVKAVYHDLAYANQKKGDYKAAFKFFNLYSDLKDSLLNEESTKSMAKMQALYDSEKKDKAILKKDAELAKQKINLTEHEEKSKRQIIILFSSLAGLLVVIIFSVMLAGRLKLIRNQNKIIEAQKELVEERNKDITDSINYAKKIQTAMLPRDEELKTLFPNSFILFKPRNIVSGDFYWCAEKGDSLYLAVADCTGHGVPGALMSMIGTSLLHQLLMHPEINNLSTLLTELDHEVIKSLKQQDKDSESRDGMDIAIVQINKKTNKLYYCGANRPLLIISNNELKELAPTKAAIGGNTFVEKKFELKEINLNKTDRIYLFSDGYADQFGGPKGKKLMTKNLKDLLITSVNVSIEEQGKLVEEKLITWQGNYEQVDDVCVVGVEV